MGADITSLLRVVDAPEGKPVRPEAQGNQRLMEAVLEDPTAWTHELADLTTEVFDQLSVTWVDERGGYRLAPLADALARGGAPTRGRCLELGSGTGVLTPSLHARWGELVCVDLSLGMMRRNPHSTQVRADASALPFPDSSFDVIVIGDAPLFAAETARVMSATSTLVWSNALGTGAPYYLATEAIVGGLSRVAPASTWSAVQGEALWGSWAVVRRR